MPFLVFYAYLICVFITKMALAIFSFLMNDPFFISARSISSHTYWLLTKEIWTVIKIKMFYICANNILARLR